MKLSIYSVTPSQLARSIRTSFFFINHTVKGGLYLASRWGGIAAVAGTMLELCSAANSCCAWLLAVSSSQPPQKVIALREVVSERGSGGGDERTRSYATSRCGSCLNVTCGFNGTGASATCWIEDGRMKLITLEVDMTGAVIAIALPPDPFVRTGAVIATASLFWFAGVPNTLFEMG